MEGKVKFEFSVDQGTTWYDATDFGAASALLYCNKIHPFLLPEPVDDDSPENMTDSEYCYKATPRIYLMVELRARDFDLTTAAGRALYKFINALRCASIIRIYDNGASGGINGYTEWASDPNTEYLVPHDSPQPGFPSVGETVVEWNFTLKMKKEYDITTT